jgi:hypothetical protein
VSDLRPIPPREAFSVVLAAWPPPTDDRRRRPGLVPPALRHEAIVAAARAVFALGGHLVVTGDSYVAPVLAAVALDYTPAHAIELVERPPALLTVIESGGHDMTLRALLAPYVHRQAARYVDVEGRALELDAELVTAELGGYRRHPLRPWIIDRFRPRGAIFVSPHAEAEQEIEMLAAQGVGLAVLTDTVPYAEDAERWSWADPTREVIGDIPLDRWKEEGGEPRRDTEPPERRPDDLDQSRPPAGVATPYAFVLQRLIARWAR